MSNLSNHQSAGIGLEGSLCLRMRVYYYPCVSACIHKLYLNTVSIHIHICVCIVQNTQVYFLLQNIYKYLYKYVHLCMRVYITKYTSIFFITKYTNIYTNMYTYACVCILSQFVIRDFCKMVQILNWEYKSANGHMRSNNTRF